MDELLSQLCQEGEDAQEWMYELRAPPRFIHCLDSMKNDFLIEVVLNPVTRTRTLSMKGLLDSGCTSSAINRSPVPSTRRQTFYPDETTTTKARRTIAML